MGKLMESMKSQINGIRATLDARRRELQQAAVILRDKLSFDETTRIKTGEERVKTVKHDLRLMAQSLQQGFSERRRQRISNEALRLKESARFQTQLKSHNKTIFTKLRKALKSGEIGRTLTEKARNRSMKRFLESLRSFSRNRRGNVGAFLQDVQQRRRKQFKHLPSGVSRHEVDEEMELPQKEETFPYVGNQFPTHETPNGGEEAQETFKTGGEPMECEVSEASVPTQDGMIDEESDHSDPSAFFEHSAQSRKPVATRNTAQGTTREKTKKRKRKA